MVLYEINENEKIKLFEVVKRETRKNEKGRRFETFTNKELTGMSLMMYNFCSSISTTTMELEHYLSRKPLEVHALYIKSLVKNYTKIEIKKQ